ncbi:Putative helicase, Zinc finger, RING-type, Zinc finger, RING/FYVE/PHD-type [Septoria linicola]|uniref:Helicase, Zinc finger, RING-type, Zinc finger, RING/FYVE/PHD-type n=1 Tax=Septoria linicola TaxID=215465 RepID=A0A9Q9AUU9_9PEZI|nr:putative helicase, Zinc finger, RING-type, Zinc finger, RING/FYVE/PHD-type [Septoria linicola]USW51116.1 Putative helicase, Zinc finger, RING-type, Zinc finger, RING/FYVE/PHD-type [Septoria linicola]
MARLTRRSATGQTPQSTTSSASKTASRTARGSIATPRSRIDTAPLPDSDSDNVVVSRTVPRVVKGVAIPPVSAMERSAYKKPKAKSPTNSSLSSADDLSRDSSAEYETPGTTPATSIRGGPSTNGKRKRSTLGNVVTIKDSEDEEDDLTLALRLQEQEYAETRDVQPAKKKARVIEVNDSEDDISVLSEVETEDSMLANVKARRSSAKTGSHSGSKKPIKAEASSSRVLKKTPTRKASSNARSSINKSVKVKQIPDSDGSDIDLSEVDSEEFVVEDSEVPDSTGVSDTESDVPLAVARATAVPTTNRGAARIRGRRGGKAARQVGRGRRHGNITAAQAAQIAEDIQSVVGLDRKARERKKLERAHPGIKKMWTDLEKIPVIKPEAALQPDSISRKLKPFQLEGLNWMIKQEKTHYKGGLLGDEMGMGKTIQAVSLIMSDYPQKEPTLVLMPPVALMQWKTEIEEYTNGKLKVLVYHGQNSKVKGMSVKKLKEFDVILISYNSLESLHRKEVKGWSRGEDIVKEDSPIHAIHYHRLILDEAHSIKSRTTGVAKACFALEGTYKWCLSGTPVQNRIGEFFSLLRFLEVRPFADYFCKKCPCAMLHWQLDDDHMCVECKHAGMEHVSVFNQELLNPITQSEEQEDRNKAMAKLQLITARIMLRRMKRDHTSSMELPPKEVIIHNEFFGPIERDFSSSIMSNTTRTFDTYVARGVMLNNYANIFGLIMQMRQVANHPDLLLKKNAHEGQNVLVCNICDEVAEEAIRSQCKHDFCRSCVKSYVQSVEETDGEADCPRCHIPLSIDFDQPDIEQDEEVVKKSSIINRIKMEDWTSSTKIEMLIYDLYKLRSKKQTLKSIVFSQFTSMLQLIEWRLRRAGFNTVMLDGSMTPIQRQRSIDHFMNTPECEIFLVSLKAGGVALNLVEASRVFIVDPWWNPAAEWQSADRCHRIGQRRPCVITRLCIEDSVESRIVMLQEKKANMINGTINNDKVAMEKLTPEDMQFLFRGT